MSTVSVRRRALLWRRSRIPEIKSAAKSRKTAAAAIQPRCDRRSMGLTVGNCGSCPSTEIGPTVCDCIGVIPLGFMSESPLRFGAGFPMSALPSVENTENGRHEKKGGYSGEKQSADD